MPRLPFWIPADERHAPTTPGLSEKIIEAVQGGLYSMEELREWAAAQGYAPRSFVQTISDLRMDGVIETHCGGIYPADDTEDFVDYWPE